jgi:hypothetical protein
LNTSPHFYINPLHSLVPYSNVFKNDFNTYNNQHTDINYILANVNSNQVIAYDINVTQQQQILVNRTVILSFEVYPTPSYDHPQLNLFPSDYLDFRLYNIDGSVMLEFIVRGNQWMIHSYPQALMLQGNLPSQLYRNTWNKVRVVNYDPLNGEKLSIYWMYESDDEENLLLNASMNPIPMEECGRCEIHIDIQNSLLYRQTSNYFRELEDGLIANVDLQDSHLSYQVRNFQFNIATYNIDEDTYDPTTHNIIIGKDIYVQGIDNICMGNQFVTSGNQSIIVGNSIGGGQDSTSINDIFQSIIVGNASFRNSIVRDIICIGNDNFNNLSSEDTQRTQYFFAQKPIVIGNGVDASKIDFNINIGNVFLYTSVGYKQIYLGIDQQSVAIGYSSNEVLSPVQHKLYVNGSIKAASVSTSQIVKEMVSSTYIEPYTFVAEDATDYVYTANTTSNALVIGLCKNTFLRSDGLYDVHIVTDGKMKVWCSTQVNSGDLLVSDSRGYAMSRGQDTSIHSFTFAKSLHTWDPNDPLATPEITTSNIPTYGLIGLITCCLI